MDYEREIKYYYRVQMRQVKVTADVELKSSLGIITVNDQQDQLVVSISSASAVIYPLRTYLRLKKFSSVSKYLNQKIVMIVSDKEVIEIEHGKINFLAKFWLFKFLFRSIFTKGI